MHVRPFAYGLIALFVGLTGLAVPSRGQAADDTAGLRREVEALKQTVQRLEQRITDLENRSSTQVAVPSAGRQRNPAESGVGEPAAGVPRTDPAMSQAADDRQAAPSSIRHRWQRLDRRMTARQVEDLLGAPQQKFTVADTIVWYYRYPEHGGGSVTFSRDMRVAGWQAPPGTGL